MKKWGCEIDYCEEETTQLSEEELLPEENEGEKEELLTNRKMLPEIQSPLSEDEISEPNFNSVKENLNHTILEEGNETGYSLSDVEVSSNIASQKAEEFIPYWESWVKNGFFVSLWGTWVNVLFHPDKFFKNLPDGGILNMLFFYLMFSGITFSTSFVALIPAMKSMSVTLYLSILGGGIVFLIINFFITALVLHFSIYIFGNPRGVKKTLQVVAYSSAADIFSIIPLIGLVITYYYKIILYVTGIANTHKISVASSTAAVLLPLFAIILFMIIVFVATLFILGGTDAEQIIHLFRSYHIFSFFI